MARRWFRVDGLVWREVIVLVTLAVGFGKVCGAPTTTAATEPSAAASGLDVGCTRPLVDVIWGFLITLLALTIPLWGTIKHWDGDNILAKFLTVMCGLFAPLTDLRLHVEGSCRCILMLWKYHEYHHRYEYGLKPPKTYLSKRLCSSIFPWSRFPVRIIAACDIVVYTSNGSELLHNGVLWDYVRSSVTDESEAMLIGEVVDAETLRRHCTRRVLSREVAVALVFAKVLPDYDQLKFLRGNSGFSVIAIAVQAIGYIYAIIFRSRIHLRVAPIEVVGLILNMILLIKASLFSTCNPCHRPLVIYMDKVREEKLLGFLASIQHWDGSIQLSNVKKLTCSIICVISIFLNIILIYNIINVIRVTNIKLGMPLIVFSILIFVECSFHLFFFEVVSLNNDHSIRGSLLWLSVMVFNLVVYVWIIVVTISGWKSQHFNTRAKLLNLSQLIPFIG